MTTKKKGKNVRDFDRNARCGRKKQKEEGGKGRKSEAERQQHGKKKKSVCLCVWVECAVGEGNRGAKDMGDREMVAVGGTHTHTNAVNGQVPNKQQKQNNSPRAFSISLWFPSEAFLP